MTQKPQSTELETAKPETAQAPRAKGPSPLRYVLWVFVAIIVIPVIGYFIYDAYTHADTDDAYISGHVHNISPRISGNVLNVFVDDNQEVKAGQVLVQLDSQEYDALALIAGANLTKAKGDYDRQKPLMMAKAIADQDFAATQQTYYVDEAESGLANLQLTYTKLPSPADGVIGRKNVEVGNRLSSGQTVMVLVEHHVWVVANFKETQIANMKVGQPVQIWVDRVPGHTFTGKVDSFAPGSGNEFALLPADNSTGNFTKIVQRVPVKIEFDPESIKGFEKELVPGLSVEAKVALSGPKTP